MSAHVPVVRPPVMATPQPSCFWKVLAGIVAAALIGIVVTFLAVGQLHAARTKAAAAMKTAEAANDTAGRALALVRAQAGLLQSVNQALGAAQADGTVTAAQLAAIKAQVQALQAAKAGGAIPLRSVTTRPPGVPALPAQQSRFRFAPDLTPPPHSSDTGRCLLTLDTAQILKLDGTVCPP